MKLIDFDEKGMIGIIPFILIVFLGFLILPTILFALSSISKIMFQGIMAFLIIAYVRNFGLEGPLMWIFAGILIYFLVWKYAAFTASIYMLMLMLGFGLTSAIMWGSSNLRTRLRMKQMKGE